MTMDGVRLYSLVETDTSAVLTAYAIWPTAIRSKITYMPEDCAPGGFTVPGGFQAISVVPGEAHIQPLPGWGCLYRGLLVGLDLVCQGGLRPGPKEGSPGGLQLTSAEEGFRIPPSVRVLSYTVIHKLRQ